MYAEFGAAAEMSPMVTCLFGVPVALSFSVLFMVACCVCATCAGDGSAACQLEGSTGKNLGTVGAPRFSRGHVVIKMKNGDKCSSGRHRESVIVFTCDKSAGYGTPVWL